MYSEYDTFTHGTVKIKLVGWTKLEQMEGILAAAVLLTICYISSATKFLHTTFENTSYFFI